MDTEIMQYDELKKYNYCPFHRLCGLEFFETKEGHSRIGCQETEKLLNGHGIAHGGLIFTMMDVAGGQSVSVLENGEVLSIVTQNSSVSFLRPAKPGYITAEGELIRRGKRIAVSTISVYDENRSLLAKGDFTYYILDKK